MQRGRPLDLVPRFAILLHFLSGQTLLCVSATNMSSLRKQEEGQADNVQLKCAFSADRRCGHLDLDLLSEHVTLDRLTLEDLVRQAGTGVTAHCCL